MRSRVRIAMLAVVLALAACGADDGGGAASPLPSDDSAIEVPHSTSTTLDFGDIPLDVPEGFTPIPLVSFGFGFAVPDGWQVTLLTDQAIEAVERARLVDPAFVDAARKLVGTGAMLYGAGVAPDGTVADLKLDAEDADDPAARMVELTAEIRANAALSNVEVSADDLSRPPTVVIRFETPGPDGGTAHGTQYLFELVDGVVSMIITSEDAESHDALADAIAATFAVDPRFL